MPRSRVWTWPAAVMATLVGLVLATGTSAEPAEVFARIVVALVLGLLLGLAGVALAFALARRPARPDAAAAGEGP